MLTARGDDFDIVGGLEAGADDYVVKPVEPRVSANLEAVDTRKHDVKHDDVRRGIADGNKCRLA